MKGNRRRQRRGPNGMIGTVFFRYAQQWLERDVCDEQLMRGRVQKVYARRRVVCLPRSRRTAVTIFRTKGRGE